MQRIVSIFFTLVESGYLHCTTQIVNLDDDAGFQTRIINIFFSLIVIWLIKIWCMICEVRGQRIHG